MQLYCESGDIDNAIEELKLAMPVVALTNIVDRRVRHHKKRAELQRELIRLRARQLAKEAA